MNDCYDCKYFEPTGCSECDMGYCNYWEEYYHSCQIIHCKEFKSKVEIDE